MTSSTNLTQHLLKFRAVPTYACTPNNKLDRTLVKIKPLKALAIIRADVTTNSVRNRMHKVLHLHNCIKMDNK